jgi:Flp pilus assembly protein TadD
LLRGNAYKKLGRIDDAITDYLSAMDLPKLAAKACWRIAECYCLRNDENSAVEWLQKSVSRGFSDFKKWKNDSDLSLLKNNGEFQKITGM